MKGSLSILGFTSLAFTLLICIYLNYLHVYNPASPTMNIDRSETALEGGVTKSIFLRNGSPLSYADAVRLLEEGFEPFINLVDTAIAAHPSNALFWECPSFSRKDIESIPFEFVLIPSSDLESIITDISPFRAHFAAHRNSTSGPIGPSEVVTFKSLGGDASLIVPCPADLADLTTSPPEMAHLALFIRHASAEHKLEMWRSVGRAVLASLESSEPHTRFWLSTSGLGVSWLHVRVDTVPKYYHWPEYKNARS